MLPGSPLDGSFSPDPGPGGKLHKEIVNIRTAAGLGGDAAGRGQELTGHGPSCQGHPPDHQPMSQKPGSETLRSSRPSLASPEQDAQALGVSGGVGVARTPPTVGNSFRERTQDDTSHDPLPDFPGLQVSRLQPRPSEEGSFLERSHSALFSPLPPLLSPSPFLSLSSPYSALLSSPQTPSSAIFSC